MKRLVFNICLVGLRIIEANAQNLVSNSSFSEVVANKDTNEAYRFLPGKSSNVKSWYLPEYINYSLNGDWYLTDYSDTRYLSVRNNHLTKKDKLHLFGNGFNIDLLFERNLGFALLRSSKNNVAAVIQQYWSSPIKAGKYCIKFRYKYLSYNASVNAPPSLDIAISATDLKEYYRDKIVRLPATLVTVSIKDSSEVSDENTPWQQHCRIVELDGLEHYLTVGILKYGGIGSWGSFFVDDIELYEITNNDTCRCEHLEKNLSLSLKKNFQINKIIINDSMSMFTPTSYSHTYLISPTMRHTLNEIISFLQRYPLLCLQLIEYNHFYRPKMNPLFCSTIVKYLRFFGISNDRITVRTDKCQENLKKIYCGPTSDYTMIGFRFYQ